MLSKIIKFSLYNKGTVVFFTSCIVIFGLYSLTQIPIGAVPDITNNQVQVITTSRNLSTQDIEQFITYPVELEMANLPGVTEIRSVSKFGLSVVTIVFDDSMGTYLPRQLIAEKIRSASEKIPRDFGTPEMGPITTGLGEIYQYILDVKPGYESRYTATDLRTIQDWIIKRQLSGIPGVVEVNSWGGYLKQYEVAVNTTKLNAMNITMAEIFTALEQNNSVAGGGYIEKVNQAYFIRGEGLVSTLADIENTVVVNRKGVPIFIKDIGKVGFGKATRFGAVTANGEGEKVLGQVMMLKNSNSKKVIDAVKERVASVSGSLPEGVYINAFLDRSKLIEKTTFTVAENLILGCLIVIFVVVLILGNMRSGLVVASVIPISLLFALSLMYLFDIDANLMSLGAIDFGIIIDGAVIIVEFVAFRITSQKDELTTSNHTQRQEKTNELVYRSASEMMNSAVFGQLIILIVFIPILSLSGVEGKMFTPMALTFSFALIGAMLLCFTYVPVVAALFIKPSAPSSKNISVRFMNWLQKKYEPVISWALYHKKIVLALALVFIGAAFFLFSRMGAEFVPTLDEGDFVIQPVLKTGTSLSKTIETTTQIEKILLKFPEVEQVVTRIGAAEIPTDPMSMEESDVIITLKPGNTWVSASSKDELADRFKEALSVLPGIDLEFTQPIEMRFNELITGVRADIAIKIFGDDLEVLQKKANEVKEYIKDIEGAADVVVEKIAGLPQMKVTYDRARLARYGLHIAEVNRLVSMGFGGYVTGSVFEGEKRFDLVIRLDEQHRESITNLKNMYVDIPSGGKVPLKELARISYEKGAAKISRDDTKRRIVVGINVRNRDLQSVVDDIRQRLEKQLQLPVGYSITYGGQFENLKSARNRLKIAVPVALILIFVLLYFAFKSIREALIVFSAIPLAAFGGVLLLWLRGMPFSISAGVGFIALFGIAVLNGIVLIEHFKELKSKGMKTKEEYILTGAKNRLRAVLLTATAAALGFLPMAVSTSAGAEVQRPLATVVIGGLVTATLLTLIVLPVLYALFGSNGEKPQKTPKNTSVPKNSLTILAVLFLSGIYAQETPALHCEQLKEMAMESNAALKASSLRVEETNAMIGTAFSFDKTEVYYGYDENNLAINEKPIYVVGVQQSFLFPTVYFAGKKVNELEHEMEKSSYILKKLAVEREVESAYYQLQYEMQKKEVYQYLDSLYAKFAYAAQRKFELGETNYLEKITAKAKRKQLQTQYRQAEQDIAQAYARIQKVVQHDDTLVIVKQPPGKLSLWSKTIADHEGITYYKNKKSLYQAKNRYEKQSLLPDITLNYFTGSNATLNDQLYGYQIGLKIPLLFGGNTSKIKASRIAAQMVTEEAKEYTFMLEARYKKLNAQLTKHNEALLYYENEGEELSQELLKTASRSYQSGEIDFFQYINSLENAYTITLSYLESLHAYNQTVITINYLTL
ncbi:CusA/CzcA family heavy metal efflux RND transporter [Ascidiimonas aurantiaca]|uniref:CusA/CzcA family heavy metal efflux RND transporter n=1 Tax=Ascidiimonas aurantiaca TaxID=1685432 RepID=UPI0030ED4F2B